MHLLFRILKFRFLKVAPKERFLQFCCLGHKDWFSWPKVKSIVKRICCRIYDKISLTKIGFLTSPRVLYGI
jgi:hypothetical protein